MFKYHSLALKNAKPQILKTILFSIVSFIVVFAVFAVARTFFMQYFMQMQLAAQLQQSSGPYLIIMILALLLGLLFFIFAGYQLLAGAINVIAKAISREDVHFNDLFVAFKKGKYGKSLILSLISIGLFIVMYLIIMALNYLFNLALTPLFTSLQSAVSSPDNTIAILLTIQIIILIIIGLITSIVSWFFFILMINYTVSLVRESNYSAMSHFKDGFRGIRNGHKTWFKFFIAVLLINLIIIIITQPLGTILSVTTGNMSQKVATVILYVAQVIIVVLRLILYFVLMMGAVQYFLKRGEKLNKTTNEKKKKHKNKDKSVTNKNETLSNQQKIDNTHQPSKNNVEGHSNNVTNNVKQKSENAKDEVSHNFNKDK
ncbi:hypothetical protein [Staphylococcus haemolyticus]|uniref:hypothetical protein n=1 Tax=Staphylococcus haemolyticus TaxID=1283 RepID=UPI00069CFBC2|nr:hypothetical protein [Staphylococcus haemolyticus]